MREDSRGMLFLFFLLTSTQAVNSIYLFLNHFSDQAALPSHSSADEGTGIPGVRVAAHPKASNREQNNLLGLSSLCISPPSTQLKKNKITKTICPGDSESPQLEESPVSVTLHHAGFRSILMGLRLVTQLFSPVLAHAVAHQEVTEICTHHKVWLRGK